LNELSRLEDQLLDIEARIALLEACRPVGIAAEEARLEALLDSRAPKADDLVPKLGCPRHAPLELERIRLGQVAMVCQKLAASSAVARILTERTHELELEIEIVQARGTTRIVDLARARFDRDGADARVHADVLAMDWIERGISREKEPEQALVPLASALSDLASRAGVEVEVLEVDMVARAAVTQRALLVRRGALVTSREAGRIFTHEVYGHLLPRRAALSCGPPFRIGPRGADADEEGRALQLEVQSGTLDATRGLELGVRHRLAAHVLGGGHVGEAVLALCEQGVPGSLLARAAPRVMRAGGLCREIIYLPALLRVGPRLSDPRVERVFCLGRATLSELDVLTGLLPPTQGAQARSATTGV